MILALLLAAQVVWCEGDVTDEVAKRVGQAIPFSSGTCRISDPLVIGKPTEIYGAGMNRTRIEAPRGFAGGPARLTVSDVTIWRADRPTETSTRAIGINASGGLELTNVGIEGFTVGAYVYADSDSFGTNSNGWRMRNIRVMGSAHAGIIIRGRDANGGLGEAIRAQTNCERSTRWEKDFGPCAGIVDRSFLGNTWIAPLMSTNGERAPEGFIPAPPFISQGASQHSVWVGVYCERDQSAGLTDQGTIVLGGLCSRVSGDGLRVDGRAVNGLIVRNAKDPKNAVTMRMGESAASGTWYELAADAIDPSRPLRKKAEIRGEALSQRCYREDLANQIVVSRTCQDGSKP